MHSSESLARNSRVPTSRFSIGVEVATGVRPDGDAAVAVTGAVVGARIVGATVGAEALDVVLVDVGALVVEVFDVGARVGVEAFAVGAGVGLEALDVGEALGVV